jgi:hypothetical protein
MGLGMAPLVHRTEQCEMISHTERTFSNMVCESVKSFSMASTSASLGVLVRKRPVILCMRCILQWDDSDRVRRGPEVRRGQNDTRYGQRAVGNACASASGGCAQSRVVIEVKVSRGSDRPRTTGRNNSCPLRPTCCLKWIVRYSRGSNFASSPLESGQPIRHYCYA